MVPEFLLRPVGESGAVSTKAPTEFNGEYESLKPFKFAAFPRTITVSPLYKLNGSDLSVLIEILHHNYSTIFESLPSQVAKLVLNVSEGDLY